MNHPAAPPPPCEPALPRAISYARFSSGSQAKGTSIDRQIHAFETWLERHRTSYTPLYLRDEGVSAYKGKNASKGSLAILLDNISAGTIKAGDLLVVEAIDRLSRQAMLDSFDLVKEILRSGISILTLENNQIYDKDSLNGAAIFSLIANLQAAHAYSKRLGERVAAAHESKRVKARAKEEIGKVIVAPWLKDGKRLEPFASLVRKAIALYLKGYGTRQIAIELQTDIKANDILHERYGTKLNASTVRKWLKAPELIGHWDSKNGLIENCLEPLITNVEYSQIQQESTRRLKTPSKSNEYVLAGLVRCARCGASFHTRIQKPRPTIDAPANSEALKSKPKIFYSNCSNYLKNGSCDNNSTWPYSVLLFVFQYGLTGVLADIQQSKNKDSDANLEEFNEQIAALEISIDRSSALYEATGDEKHFDKVKNKSDELKKVKIKLKEREASLAALATGLGGSEFDKGFNNQVGSDLSHFENLPIVEARKLYKQFNYSISVYGKTATLTLSPEGREQFILQRRLQKYANAYLVKVDLPRVSNPLENNWTRFYAVGREGSILADASTEEEVISLLAGLST